MLTVSLGSGVVIRLIFNRIRNYQCFYTIQYEELRSLFPLSFLVDVAIIKVKRNTGVLLDHYFCTDVGIIGGMAHNGPIPVTPTSREK